MLHFIHGDKFPVTDGFQDLIQGHVITMANISRHCAFILIGLEFQGFRIIFLHDETPHLCEILTMDIQ
jgi:hypothetical protein